MSKQHGTETLTFESFSGYYGSVPQGYGGFVWSDVDFMNSSFWQTEKTSWCDTGYQNALDGDGLAFARYLGTGYYPPQQAYKASAAYFRSENIKETFSLVSMVAASAWESNQPFKFTSYVYEPNIGFLPKASVTLYLSQTPQTINFDHLPVPMPIAHGFDNISAIRIKSETGTYGNSCSYGANQTHGNQMAFDDMQVKWSGATPHKMGAQPARPLNANLHRAGAADHAANMHAGQSHASGAEGAHHAENLSLPSHETAALTGQFHLPNIEHFGS
jgi:hypothetical protein